MRIERRIFFRQLATGVAAGAALPVLRESAWAGTWPAPRAYVPGGPVRLDSNENAYGPSAKAMEAIQSNLDSANRYPKGEYEALVAAIAARHGVKTEQVVLGCGSSENLRMAASAYLGPGKLLIYANPTFESIAHHAQAEGAQVASLPLTRDYAHDLNGMLDRAAGAAGLVYICNPNNPTGTLTPRADLEAFLRKLPPTFKVLMDEAYHHFVVDNPAYTSFLDKPVDDDRVIVTRTFSKIYGLAGIRIGYAIATVETAKQLAAQRMGFAITVLTARAALAAWNDTDAVRIGAARNASDRQEFYRQAKSRNLALIPSEANFVMLQSGRPADYVIDHFKKNNVLIGRPFPPMTDYVRISLATPPEMQEFWRVWDLLPAKQLPS
jgi:histidinol-phosphate aminotransferase